MAEVVASGLGKRGAAEPVELAREEQAHARRVAESKAIVPHQYLRVCAAARPAAELAAVEGAEPLDALLRAVALALRAHPRANGSYRDGKLTRHDRVNPAFAVEAGEVAIHPTLPDADATGLAELAAERRRLAGRVAEGTIAPPELAGATFTVTDLGATGVTSADPVIVPPQAGALAAGAPDAGGRITLTLAADARILHGHAAARFLSEVARLLEAPEELR